MRCDNRHSARRGRDGRAGSRNERAGRAGSKDRRAGRSDWSGSKGGLRRFHVVRADVLVIGGRGESGGSAVVHGLSLGLGRSGGSRGSRPGVNTLLAVIVSVTVTHET